MKNKKLSKQISFKCKNMNKLLIGSTLKPWKYSYVILSPRWLDTPGPNNLSLLGWLAGLTEFMANLVFKLSFSWAWGWACQFVLNFQDDPIITQQGTVCVGGWGVGMVPDQLYSIWCPAKLLVRAECVRCPALSQRSGHYCCYWSERSACAALGCWHKRRWPLF
jgi:hypothetical protein